MPAPRVRSPFFDLVRASAALAVLLSHARSLVLRDATDQPALSAVDRCFFALTGLGHQAVIVFFVLSGAVVTELMRHKADRSLKSHGGNGAQANSSFRGGKAEPGIGAQTTPANEPRFRIFASLVRNKGRIGTGSTRGLTWRWFAFDRLTRLWVVLLPCLIVGAGWDAIGLRYGAVPTASYGLPSIAHAAVPALDPLTFVGNVLFLQTIAVSWFGSNGPLWSLAYEAWYYLLAMLAWSAWLRREQPWQVATHGAAGALIVGVVFTPDMRALAPAWLLGAALAFLPPTKTNPRIRVLTLVAFACVVGAARAEAVHHPIAAAWTVAVATCGLLWAWRDWQPGQDRAARAVSWLAASSFSLYLSHVPLLACLQALALPRGRLPMGAVSLAWFAAFVGLALLHAAVVWWLFESRTSAVRGFLRRFADAAGRASLPSPLRRGAGGEGYGRPTHEHGGSVS